MPCWNVVTTTQAEIVGEADKFNWERLQIVANEQGIEIRRDGSNLILEDVRYYGARRRSRADIVRIVRQQYSLKTVQVGLARFGMVQREGETESERQIKLTVGRR